MTSTLDRIEVASVNLSVAKGTVKQPAASITIDARGVVGDAHAGDWHRQVSLLGLASVERFVQKTGRPTGPGEFAENLTLRGMDLADVRLLDRFRIGKVELEVSQIGKECHGDSCAIFREVGQCIMPREGIFCRVITGGEVKPGDRVEFLPRVWRFWVITLSDRAAAGVYSDRSGPKLAELLERYAAARKLRVSIERRLLPDEAGLLRQALEEARGACADAVFCTGGTGVGPRDVTPEVATAFCDKLIPGVMEAIRMKYGAERPAAWLSRSVAGVAGQMLLFTLPGSVRAVEEYLAEISKVLEHLLFMLHTLDVH
jgi:molybdopterin adenylyltransferase